MTKRYSVLVVDDEAPARAKLKRLLADDDRFTLVGEAADGEQAVARIESLRPDLLLLDVQMPGLTGFEVLETLGAESCPQVIFSTAYDQFALKAFDAHAVDYLLKPYDAERFRKALDKAWAQLEAGRTEPQQVQALLSGLERSGPPERPLERLLVKVGEAWIALRVDRVRRFSAEDKYVRVFSDQGQHLVRQTLKSLETRLDPRRFVRVHRSELVQLEAVVRLEPWSHGDGLLVLADGSSVVLSRTFREAFLERWGVEG
ncbi:LytTR family DNA-binding domain-containing protein [Hyalangium sp.]|uniref:LytR/AlgR family response regulator transcription factor n=1 Tax=Hyalangium sp. TaxID=2028555 RepID=UPI002D5BB48C|nr:LytTR family DNA-binding domain-containing protein [Hyalangium sp.]HYI00367.1 LytTR family DNA-binding domain-containing protein [Hyalangium sp.]